MPSLGFPLIVDIPFEFSYVIVILFFDTLSLEPNIGYYLPQYIPSDSTFLV
jgi:hypothetical protein